MHNITTQLPELLHDLAGPLSVLSLCLPEIEKRHTRGSTNAKNTQLTELLQLCTTALGEAKTTLRNAQRQLDLLEEKES